MNKYIIKICLPYDVITNVTVQYASLKESIATTSENKIKLIPVKKIRSPDLIEDKRFHNAKLNSECSKVEIANGTRKCMPIE